MSGFKKTNNMCLWPKCNNRAYVYDEDGIRIFLCKDHLKNLMEGIRDTRWKKQRV